jgi:hypothetical protein
MTTMDPPAEDVPAAYKCECCRAYAAVPRGSELAKELDKMADACADPVAVRRGLSARIGRMCSMCIRSTCKTEPR